MKNLENLESDLEFFALMKKAKEADSMSFQPFALKQLMNSNPSKFKELAEEAKCSHDMEMREWFEFQENAKKLLEGK